MSEDYSKVLHSDQCGMYVIVCQNFKRQACQCLLQTSGLRARTVRRRGGPPDSGGLVVCVERTRAEGDTHPVD